VPESASAARFIKTAQAYITLIETSGSHEGTAFFKECFTLVSKLLSETGDLPEVGKLRTGPEVTSDEYAEIVRRLKHQVGERDSYRKFLDPWKTEDPLYGSVSEDLADIWRDLKHGMLVLTKNDPSHAICEWRFSFFYHWGPFHATGLLRPLFALAFREELES
jgi:Domain of unknown function (DUF5063)